MKTYKFTSVIWKEKEGYVSKCPELGVASAGDTVEEALKNLKTFLDLSYDFKLTMIMAFNYKEIGQRDKAISIYEALLKRQDLISRDRLSIAIEFASMGEDRRAIRIAENLMKKDPTFSKSNLKFIEDVRSGKFRDKKMKAFKK